MKDDGGTEPKEELRSRFLGVESPSKSKHLRSGEELSSWVWVVDGGGTGRAV